MIQVKCTSRTRNLSEKVSRQKEIEKCKGLKKIGVLHFATQTIKTDILHPQTTTDCQIIPLFPSLPVKNTNNGQFETISIVGC